MTPEPDTSSAGAPNGRERRFACEYPGMIRMLFPAKSFVPLSFAVRVTNVSSGGALVELHESNLDPTVRTMEGCYFELKVATGSAPTMYGVVVRSDLRAEPKILGLKFHHAYPELTGSLIHEDTQADLEERSPELPIPQLEPYSPITDEPVIVLNGRAHYAEELTITDDQQKTTTIEVKEDTFVARLKLPHEGPNVFRFTSRGKGRFSPPLKVTIEHQPLPQDDFHFHVETHREQGDLHSLAMEYMGSARQAGRLMEEMARLAPAGRRARVTVRLSAPEEFSADDLKRLRDAAEEIRRESVAEED